jgi:hypothetical protein
MDTLFDYRNWRPPVRFLLALPAVLIGWAWSDILIWQRIFEANHADHIQAFDRAYQAGHQFILVLLIAVVAIALWSRWSLVFAAATWTLAYSGLADVLYYWLDGRALPAILPWLDTEHPFILFHPVTGGSVVASSALWIAAWTLVLAGLAWRTQLRRLLDAVERWLQPGETYGESLEREWKR